MRAQTASRSAGPRMPAQSSVTALDEAAGGQVGVDVHQQVGGPGPGVAAGPQHRPGAQPLGQQRLGQDLAHPGGVGLGVGVLDQVAGAAVVDQAAQAARRRRPPPGCRRPPPPGPPARTTPTGWAPGTRRRPGSRSTAARGAGAATKRTWSRRPSDVDQPVDAGHLLVAVGPARAADDDQSGVGVVPDHRGQGGRRPRPRPSAAGSGPTKSSSGPSAGRPRARRAWARSPGPKKAWSTPGATIRMRDGSAP